jgi:hypothetical protein
MFTLLACLLFYLYRRYAFAEFFTDQDALRVYEHLIDAKCPLLENKHRLQVAWPNLFTEQHATPQTTMMRRRMWGSLLSLGRFSLASLPRLAALLAVACIGSCFLIAKNNEHIPNDLLFIPISLAACGAPERHVYAVSYLSLSSPMPFSSSGFLHL